MLRAIASSLLSLVVVATFLWGGCVSCEQYFMFPDKSQVRSCCNKSGQCERPGKTSSKTETQDCNRLPLSRGENAHVLPLPALVQVVIAQPILKFSSHEWLRVSTLEALLDPSPPDLQALNVTFLI